jgi:hypothetical protein
MSTTHQVLHHFSASLDRAHSLLASIHTSLQRLEQSNNARGDSLGKTRRTLLDLNRSLRRGNSRSTIAQAIRDGTLPNKWRGSKLRAHRVLTPYSLYIEYRGKFYWIEGAKLPRHRKVVNE